MGAYAPLPWLPEGAVDDIVDAVARPTIAELARRGTPFAGLLYVGLAITKRGPRVVEYAQQVHDAVEQALAPAG